MKSERLGILLLSRHEGKETAVPDIPQLQQPNESNSKELVSYDGNARLLLLQVGTRSHKIAKKNQKRRQKILSYPNLGVCASVVAVFAMLGQTGGVLLTLQNIYFGIR